MNADRAAALFFDCDGTLAYTLDIYERAWLGGLADHGAELSSAFYWERTGFSAAAMIQDAAALSGADLAHGPVHASVLERYFAEVDKVRPHEPLLALARRRQGKAPLAVVSSGPRAAVLAALRAIGATDLFDHVITGEDAERPKPAPDLYLLAARASGQEPASCLAFEDSDEGLASARAAGVPAVDVRPAAGTAWSW